MHNVVFAQSRVALQRAGLKVEFTVVWTVRGGQGSDNWGFICNIGIKFTFRQCRSQRLVAGWFSTNRGF